MTPLQAALAQLPLIAILRGLRPDEAMDIGRALDGEGWCVIEVPLNSPHPLQSIAALSRGFPHLLVGAGTVLRPEQVHDVHKAGGRLVVAPNFNAAVVQAAVDLGIACIPGVATPSEAFAALEAGSSALKLFPAEMVPPSAVKAMRAVLPEPALLLPVGGITAANMKPYRDAGANGFGIGSSLFRPGDSAAQVRAKAAEFAAAAR